METKKSKVREALDSLIEGTMAFLLGEEENDDETGQVKLYTPEERKELMGVKKDIEMSRRRHPL